MITPAIFRGGINVRYGSEADRRLGWLADVARFGRARYRGGLCGEEVEDELDQSTFITD